MQPRLAFAYDPQFTEHVFAAEQLQRLAGLCQILRHEPLLELNSPEARAVLAETEILVTGWGPPQLDATTLQVAPRLRLIAHSAGSIKYFIAPEVVERVAVTSAVVANAVPVAEFTVAAILFANKGVLAFRDIYRRERRHLRSHPLMRRNWGTIARPSASSAPRASGSKPSNCWRPTTSSCCALPPVPRRSRRRRWGWNWSNSTNCWLDPTSRRCTPRRCLRPGT